MKQRILQKQLQGLFKQATFGIEKEGQRVTSSGHIAKTLHPKNFGDRAYHPYIQTDFAESQLELITATTQSETDALRYLSAIHEVTLRQLPEDEYIWPLSMPMLLPHETDILEAQLNETDTAYREYLSKKYGKYKQMVSGIHFNMGFSTAFLEQLKQDTETLSDIQNNVYMTVARRFMRYQWVLVYLLGASSLVDEKYYDHHEHLNKPVKSIRASRYGYVNSDDIQVSFDSLTDYVTSLRQLVDTKKLIAEKEFYSSVRFRGASSVVEFLEKGIQYVEYRLFDLNPFAPYGILEKDARFIHLFIMLMLWLEESDENIMLGKEKSEKTALSHPLDLPLYIEEGQWLFEQFLDMAQYCQFSQKDIDIICEKQHQLLYPEETVGGKLWMLYEEKGDMLEVGLSLAKQYKKEAVEKPFGLSAFSNMELSTQAFMADAIQQGIHVELLDEHDQFLKLTYRNHDEYVKNGNMTSKDSYISPLIMENKVVTKKVLEKAGFKVPHSIQCQTVDEAMEQFPLVSGKPIVIKPKSTNYGLGITIFQNGTRDKEDFKQAVTIALKEDKEIMIEDFIAGTEYRFFVIDGKTKAVLLRVPANVIGDGLHSIKELVDMKNQSILRGDGKTTPLKQIELSDIEQLQLKEQGFTVNTVLNQGEIAYLRANSNISTGGDSIDMTDEVDSSYKDIAQNITKAMFARVCGVDLIIPDIKVPASSNSNYGIIEANFNPMMMMHIFPAKGQSRRLTTDVLKMLFTEKDDWYE
ncbi:bifunctional glutamate--cysteine ligase GshA/glutathione synthetase GshB [Granulicatella sp. zg-ZJ]|uniref:bifunctional glutamate--cysteine ligase GshA/glutathione synthetase GshB n=1 Tax=Granulicatella sp. zg-ZJ TaxID=2678504 RepID=UPI0013D090F3|nr:bifunctional glutamate--cysteine ligase GshA/glutathione synthetase GshB [Granulicatella sp. zg-ZJ]NEW62889.1 bifunctional glutamate--cysteine ligase GshA/glutathione synthetase GshB [Granulicatella sp. zg-ZJ]